MCQWDMHFENSAEVSKGYINHQEFQTIKFRAVIFAHKIGISDKEFANCSLIFSILSKLAVSIIKKWSSYVPLLKEILPQSLLIVILSGSLVESKLERRIFSSKNDAIGPKKYF